MLTASVRRTAPARLRRCGLARPACGLRDTGFQQESDPAAGAPSLTNVFISYRRSDTSAHAGHIAAGLRAHASRPEVFLDTSGIEPGAPWPDALTQALSACNVMLVVIGPRWAEPLPGQARGRLFDPGDVVAEELRHALGRRQVTVVPVLVGGASRPTAADLPEDLAPLLLRQGRPLRDDTFDDDLAALARRVLVPRWWDRPLVRTAGGVAAAAMLGAGALWLWPHPPAGPGRPIDLDVEVRYTPKPTAGGLAPVLQLMEDRSMARDAVHLPLDAEALCAEIEALGGEIRF